MAVDVLVVDGERFEFSAPRVETKNTHGTGCTLSAAIACFLAQGFALPEVVRRAKDYLTGALQRADDLDVGAGHGPVHHFWEFCADSHEDQAFRRHAGSASFDAKPQSRFLGAPLETENTEND